MNGVRKQASNFCYMCGIFISNFSKHKCRYFCVCCRTNECDSTSINTDVNYKSCLTCKRSFKSVACYEIHKKSICTYIKYCPLCDVTYKYKEHSCTRTQCRICTKRYSINEPHDCIMIAKKLLSLSKIYLVAFFDIETLILPTKEFQPNL